MNTFGKIWTSYLLRRQSLPVHCFLSWIAFPYHPIILEGSSLVLLQNHSQYVNRIIVGLLYIIEMVRVANCQLWLLSSSSFKLWKPKHYCLTKSDARLCEIRKKGISNHNLLHSVKNTSTARQSIGIPNLICISSISGLD